MILRYSLAQGRVPSKSAIRVTVHRSSSVSLIDSQIATRSPRVHDFNLEIRTEILLSCITSKCTIITGKIQSYIGIDSKISRKKADITATGTIKRKGMSVNRPLKSSSGAPVQARAWGNFFCFSTPTKP